MRATYLQLSFAGCGLLLALMFSMRAYAIHDGYLEACKENSFLRCEEVKKACSQVDSVIIPKSDGPTEIEKKNLKGCSSKEEYYGYGKPPDLIKARKCAYLEYEQGDSMDETFSGSSILIMIYANGTGVKKSIDLALKLACDDGKGQVAEYESHILHLERLRDSEDKFDFCDDSESRLMTGRCAAKDAEISRLEREGKLAKLLSTWSVSEQQQFEKLQTVWQSHVSISDEEVSRDSTIGILDSIYEKNAKQEQFLNSLINFERGKFPLYSEKEFAQTDRELNFVYRKIQNATEDEIIGYSWDTITKEKIKHVQRSWIQYRDAWVEFAKHKYPTVSAASWKTMLTRERVEQLRALIENRE